MSDGMGDMVSVSTSISLFNSLLGIRLFFEMSVIFFSISSNRKSGA